MTQRESLRVPARLARAVAAATVAAVVLGACSQSPSGPASSAAPTTTAEATAPATPLVGPSTRPTAPGPSKPAPRPSAPPDVTLTVEGGDPQIGQLGSYTWLDAGSDSPWLPGTPVSAGAGEPLSVVVGDGIPVADWSARRAAAGTVDGAGAIELGHGIGSGRIEFPAPDPGRWSLQVTIRFADDLGDAAYYWELDVN